MMSENVQPMTITVLGSSDNHVPGLSGRSIFATSNKNNRLTTAPGIPTKSSNSKSAVKCISFCGVRDTPETTDETDLDYTADTPSVLSSSKFSEIGNNQDNNKLHASCSREGIDKNGRTASESGRYSVLPMDEPPLAGGPTRSSKREKFKRVFRRSTSGSSQSFSSSINFKSENVKTTISRPPISRNVFRLRNAKPCGRSFITDPPDNSISNRADPSVIGNVNISQYGDIQYRGSPDTGRKEDVVSQSLRSTQEDVNEKYSIKDKFQEAKRNETYLVASPSIPVYPNSMIDPPSTSTSYYTAADNLPSRSPSEYSPSRSPPRQSNREASLGIPPYSPPAKQKGSKTATAVGPSSILTEPVSRGKATGSLTLDIKNKRAGNEMKTSSLNNGDSPFTQAMMSNSPISPFQIQPIADSGTSAIFSQLEKYESNKQQPYTISTSYLREQSSESSSIDEKLNCSENGSPFASTMTQVRDELSANEPIQRKGSKSPQIRNSRSPTVNRAGSLALEPKFSELTLPANVKQPSPKDKRQKIETPSTVVSSSSPGIVELIETASDELVKKWSEELIEVLTDAGNAICGIPHQKLETLQKNVLKQLTYWNISAKFIFKPYRDRSETPNTFQSEYALKEHLVRNNFRPPPGIMAEENISFFAQFKFINPSIKQLTPSTPPSELLSLFMGPNGNGGETGGRAVAKSLFYDVHNLPVPMFSSDPATQDRSAALPPKGGNSKGGFAKYLASPHLPVVIKTVFVPLDELRKTSAVINSSVLFSFFDGMVNGWELHRLRIFNHMSTKYLTFFPIIEKLGAADLKRLGWAQVNASNYSMKYKLLDNGNVISYMDGQIDVAAEKAMALAYDGDNHKQWIPFLTETKRLFDINTFAITMQYRAALPWPLSDRRVRMVGMASDSLDIAPLHSVMMWGVNVPACAKSMFAVPLPDVEPSEVIMDIPVLGFLLAPDKKNPNMCKARMLAVIDPKISFIPTSVLSFMATKMSAKLISNVQNLCTKFEKTPFYNTVQENPELFGYLRTRIEYLAEQRRKGVIRT